MKQDTAEGSTITPPILARPGIGGGPLARLRLLSRPGIIAFKSAIPSARELVELRPGSGRKYAAAALAVAGGSGGMLVFRDALGVLNVGLIYLLLLFLLALFTGPGPAALAAGLSFLAFDILFVPPYSKLTVARSDHLLALFVFLGIAVVTGQLVARVRLKTEIAVREQQRAILLYELNEALIGNVTLDSILDGIVERLVHVYQAQQSRILLPDSSDTLVVRARFPSHCSSIIDRQNLAMAAWTMEHRSPAGHSTSRRRVLMPHGLTQPPLAPLQRRGPDILYLPIMTPEREIGVLEVSGRPGGGHFRDEDKRLLTSFANQAALAIERARLSDEAARAAVLAKSDELKSALLAAVSHDLRTPLAAIKASVTSLLDHSVAWDEHSRLEFLKAIDIASDRLTLMVGNLLDLSRIEGGALRPDKEWYDIEELIGDVGARISPLATNHRICTKVEPELPLAYFDYVEIAQVLMNLCENAVKYTPPGARITITGKRETNAIEIAVRDNGSGIPDDELPQVFEKFHRADKSGLIAGTGIGLAICKGLVEAHGGKIWIESELGAGTAVRFTIPFFDSPVSYR